MGFTAARKHLAIALTLSALIVPSYPVSAEPDSPNRLAETEVFGYVPYWDLGATIDFSVVTTVAYFGLPAGADGRLVRRTQTGRATTEYSRWMGPQVQAMIEATHAAGARFVLSVGRFSWNESGTAVTEALLSNPAARTTLVGEIVDEISSRGVDGVNLDFEPVLESQRDNYASFVRELRAALDVADTRYQLTIAGTPFEGAETYAMFGQLVADGAADAIFIMAYSSRRDAVAGSLSPMDSATSYHLTDFVNDYLEHVPAQALILGLPWFGREWPTKSSALHAPWRTNAALYGKARNVTYANAIARAISHGRHYDPVEQSAWVAYKTRFCDGCRLTWTQLYYDDVEALGVKFDWADTLGLRGVGIWALGYDDARPELRSLLRLHYGDLVDDVAPTGDFRVAPTRAPCPTRRKRLLFDVADETGGRGAVYVRVANAPDTDGGGVLLTGRTYPAAPEICWRGMASPLYAQWRDVAGNWSTVEPVSP